MKKTDDQVKKTSKTLNYFMGQTGNHWGKLGENLVKGSLVKRLKERGLEVNTFITNVKVRDVEFDIVAMNGKEVVVVEVKASLDPQDVPNFFKEFISI